jgi:phytanoyl-CoA hydroxylase
MGAVERMNQVKLTAEQVAQFHQLGFVHLPAFIPPDMLAEMRAGYDAATRGEYDVDGWNQKIAAGDILQLGMPNAHIPGWKSHAYLDRIVEVGKQLLGDDLEYKYDQLIYKPPGNMVELLWHQDAGYGWPGKANYRSTTCWLALSEATEEMGSLHFLPGSHKEGIAEHVGATYKNPIGGALEVKVDWSKAVVVEYGPGDVTFHHGRTLHYSRGNSTDQPRRGLSTHLWPEPNEE